MAENILMPQAGQDLEFGSVVEWKKQEGDPVAKGEVVCVIESEKVTLEIESPSEGVLLKIIVPAGQDAKVLTPIGVVGQAGEQVAPNAAPSDAEEPDEEEPKTAEAAPKATPSGKVKASGKAKKVAKEHGVDLAQVTGTGPGGRITSKDVEAYLQKKPAAAIAADVKATPTAKAMAAEKGLDLSSVRRTGAGGVITTEDVEAALKAAPIPAAESPSALTQAEEIPIVGVRRAVFRNMYASLQNQAQLTLHTEASAEGLITTRKKMNAAEGKSGRKISFNALIIKAIASALKKHPHANASVVEDKIVVWRQIHVGLAVDLGKGLIVPKVRTADAKTVPQIQAELDGLLQAAREGTLSPDDLTNGTFTLTNLGAWDIDFFTPIVNNPESAILGVGRIVERPVKKDGQLVFEPHISLSLTIDHRIIDGAPGAAFLKTIKDMIEDPVLML